VKNCSYEGCAQKAHNRGKFCGGHIYRFENNLPMDTPFAERVSNAGLVCVESGCVSKAHAKKLCRSHYRLTLVSDQICAWPDCSKNSSKSTSFCESCNNKLRNHNLKEGSLVLQKILDNYFCEACGSVERLHIDHDHRCCDGKLGGCEKCIRGLLCFDCNLALGLLRENKDRLLGLLKYIEAKELV
jgi:hypothetical protein